MDPHSRSYFVDALHFVFLNVLNKARYDFVLKLRKSGIIPDFFVDEYGVHAVCILKMIKIENLGT